MKWFVELEDPSTWSKYRFDPNVYNDTNTSNFKESFNSTLDVDRCRPVLTLLEGEQLCFSCTSNNILYNSIVLVSNALSNNRIQESLYGQNGNKTKGCIKLKR